MTPSKDKLFADGLQQIEEVFIFALTYWEQLKESGIWTVAYIIWITGDFIGFIGMYLHSWVKKKIWVDSYAHWGEAFVLSYSEFSSL